MIITHQRIACDKCRVESPGFWGPLPEYNAWLENGGWILSREVCVPLSPGSKYVKIVTQDICPECAKKEAT